SIIFDVTLPAGYHLNPTAPTRYKVDIEKGVERIAFEVKDKAQSGSSAGKVSKLPFRIPVRALSQGDAQLQLRLILYYCRQDNTGTCRIKTLVWRAPVKVTAGEGAATELKAVAKLEL
ncbi:MAG: hypothetical protein ACRD63_07365, partial [Pyrinomonadaceae bacterium]